jgi:hypothetical protein
MEFTSIAIIGTITLLALLIVVGVVYFMGHSVSRRWNNHKAETLDRWAAEGVEFTFGPAASQFGGLQSMGQAVKRGIGYAVLTQTDLRVTCAIPRTQWWAVPFKQITEVTLATNFLGKSASQTPFIVIHFKDNDNIDRLGFQVKDAETWAEKVANAAGVILKNQL